MREVLVRGREFLERKGVEESRREAEWLVAHALGLSRLELFLALERPLERAEVAAARELFVRRGRREPTAYVTGRREFYGREFRVGPGVLVPRPETELLVDRARARLAGRPGARVVDVGTGSGCLAITLALECPGLVIAAVDSSAPALEYARENARRFGAAVEFHLGDALAPVVGPLDLLVSNPPYVDPAHAADLAPEVRVHEPPEALFAPPGEPDHWARRLVSEGAAKSAPGAWILIELGHDQAARLPEWPELRGIAYKTWRDLERIERVLEVGPL